MAAGLMSTPGLRIVEGGLDDARVLALLRAHVERAVAETARGSAHALDLDGLRAPDIAFWSAWQDDGDATAVVAVGALRTLDATHGEVKSMHTAEAARGRGVGSALLRHIIAAARARGMTRLSLETGAWPYFAPARALYARHGFVECAPFGEYRADPNSVFLSLALDGAPAVSRIAAARAEDVVATLCDAFHEYPVMRYVLAPVGPDYDERLAVLIRLFVMARVLRDEPIFGVHDGAGLAAVALVSDPAAPPAPAAFAALREQTWAELGGEAERRYEAFGTACTPLMVELEHVHLNMIGVRRSAQKTGLARMLLEHVHRFAATVPGAAGVTLSTEKAANLAFYDRFGYRVTGHAQVAPELETWGLFRPTTSPARTR